jgi:hypothetical protein
MINLMITYLITLSTNYYGMRPPYLMPALEIVPFLKTEEDAGEGGLK